MHWMTRVKPHRHSNPGPQHERWITYQLSYPPLSDFFICLLLEVISFNCSGYHNGLDFLCPTATHTNTKLVAELPESDKHLNMLKAGVTIIIGITYDVMYDVLYMFTRSWLLSWFLFSIMASFGMWEPHQIIFATEEHCVKNIGFFS